MDDLSPTIKDEGASSPEHTVSQITEEEVADTVLEWPENEDDLIKMLSDQVRNVIRPAALQAKRGEVVWDLLRPLIILMNSLPAVPVTPKLFKSTQIGAGIKLFFDNTAFGTGTAEKWKVPESVSQQAKNIYETWEQDNWGETEESIAAQQLQQEQRQRRQKQQPSVQRRVNDNRVQTSRPPDPDHPIYGINGIMRGVRIVPGGQRRSYYFDPQFPKRDAKVFGHNGIEVGA
jgi:hypothetical protein